MKKNALLARAFSSSLRAPPIAASILCSSKVSSNETICNEFLDALAPDSSITLPLSMAFCTEPTINFTPNFFTKLSLKSIVSGKLCPVSM